MTVVRRYLAGTATVVMYGINRPPHDRLLALECGASQDKICLNKAASNKNEPGFQTIMEAQFGSPKSDQPDIYADGVRVTKRGAGVVTWRADCPTVVFVARDKKGNKVMTVLHAGRPAMTPVNQPGEPIRNIITIAYENLVENCIEPQVDAYIVGAICSHHFVHEGPDDEDVIKPFDQFGEIAFTNRARGALDLVSIIKYQLGCLGVQSSRIYHDGICTFETDDLASYRRACIHQPDCKEDRNAIVAVLH